MSKGVLLANCYATKWLFCQQLNGDYKNEKFNKSIKLANTLGAEKTRSRVRLWSKLAWSYRIPGQNDLNSECQRQHPTGRDHFEEKNRENTNYGSPYRAWL